MSKCDLSIIYTKEMNKNHPAEEWFGSLNAEKRNAILSSKIPAICGVKSNGKLQHIACISVSGEDGTKYQASANHDLANVYPISISMDKTNKYVVSIITKDHAKEFSFLHIDTDARDGIPNILDGTKPKWTTTKVPSAFLADKAIAKAN
jgi:hypothetical protein